jgi:hypothetical protein
MSTPRASSEHQRPPSRERHAIDRLLGERGIGRHALFLTQREGVTLPGDLESVSGFVLDHQGRVHGFWLAWDDTRGRLTLAPFYPVDNPDAEFGEDAEYQAARRDLGLA